MGLVREPKGIDFIIQSHPLSPEEENRLSDFIKQRKAEIKKRKTRRKTVVARKRKAVTASI